MTPVITTGSGGWVVFSWCCPTEWVRHHCNSRAAAEKYRCRLGCFPTHHHIIEPPPAAAVFSFEIEDQANGARP